MSEHPESLEEQAAQEGFVPDPPEYDIDEEPGDDFPEDYYYDPVQDYWDGGDLP